MAAAEGSLRTRSGTGPGLLGALLAAGVTLGALHAVWSWLAATATAEQALDQSARVAVLLIGAAALSLMWRREGPVVVLAATTCALVAHELVGDVGTPLPLALLMALCAVAGASPRSLASGSAGAIAAFVVGGALLQQRTGDVFVDYAMLVVVAWTLGSGTRVARAREQALEERVAASQREQEARTALALQDERARLARELHDIVAHSVSVVVAQARAGRAVFDRDPPAARDALLCVEETGRQAMVEMRRLLDVLRPSEEVSGAAPQPGLDQLPGLVAVVRAAGLPVTLDVRGAARPLPAGLELNAYRIVQESLTNALKHGAGAQATVVLTYGPGAVQLQVDDVGRSQCRPSGPGRGLLGMRQRAELVGGRLEVGRRSDGGFAVSATLPVPVVA